MTQFIVSFDTDYKESVIELLNEVESVRLLSKPGADGTMRIEIRAANLDEETTAIRSIEDIPGVLDLRMLRK
jgi:nitrate reductase NapAB chaperone NapD